MFGKQLNNDNTRMRSSWCTVRPQRPDTRGDELLHEMQRMVSVGEEGSRVKRLHDGKHVVPSTRLLSQLHERQDNELLKLLGTGLL